MLVEQAARAHVAIWAYCLMPNHVHLVAVPADEAGLGRAPGRKPATREADQPALL